MSNPFRAPNKKPKLPDYEELGGQFACGENRCSGYTNEAKYYQGEERLYFVCNQGHVNEVTGIKI